MGAVMQTAGGEAGLACSNYPCSKSFPYSLVALLPSYWLRLDGDPSYLSKDINTALMVLGLPCLPLLARCLSGQGVGKCYNFRTQSHFG